MSRHYVTNAPVLDRTVSRPVVVVDDLTRLHGPSGGVVILPITLNWTPRTCYDLASEAARRSLYQVVLREAHTEDEIETYLNADLLRRLWGTLTLPRAVRKFWEAQHPILAAETDRPVSLTWFQHLIAQITLEAIAELGREARLWQCWTGVCDTRKRVVVTGNG